MTNVQITNGTIRFGRTIKTGDFENKRGDVELSFNVPEGEDADAAISHVKSVSVSHLAGLLGIVGGTDVAEAKPEPKKAGKKVPATPKKEEAPAAKPAADAASMEEEDPLSDRAPLPEGVKTADAASVEEEDPLSDLLGGQEEKREITDKELTDATQKCQARAKNAPAIRKLLAECGVKSPPGRLIDMPQEHRAKYLKGLEEIKPLA